MFEPLPELLQVVVPARSPGDEAVGFPFFCRPDHFPSNSLSHAVNDITRYKSMTDEKRGKLSYTPHYVSHLP
jgi:hypothetical protein